MARPEDYKYSESHEWIKYNEKKKEATIGITDYAVKQLADAPDGSSYAAALRELFDLSVEGDALNLAELTDPRGRS